MTDMTGRCRRLHQHQCEGPTTKGLCAKHAATWEAMVKDWHDRDEASKRPTPKIDRHRAWTDAEIAIIRNNTAADAIDLLDGRTRKAVEGQRRRLGIARRTWTDTDDQVLRDHTNAEASRILGRPVSAIRSRRSNMRIPIPVFKAPWTADEDSVLHMHGIFRAEATLIGRSRADIMDRRTELGINRANKTTTTSTKAA